MSKVYIYLSDRFVFYDNFMDPLGRVNTFYYLCYWSCAFETESKTQCLQNKPNFHYT